MTKKNAEGTSPLREYRRKRDFGRTAEPLANRRRSGPKLAFVVQKHAASTLHYDVRLELDGVMKSWAVPKSPSLDPKVKRLAIEVEDHPVDYNTFEGTIPAGEYGGGTVMIWDRGSYRYAGDDSDPVAGLRAGLAGGKLEFVLAGRRLKGGWVLVRTKMRGKAKQWLLIKSDDRFADPTIDVTEKYQTSVVSRRSMKRVATEGEAESG